MCIDSANHYFFPYQVILQTALPDTGVSERSEVLTKQKPTGEPRMDRLGWHREYSRPCCSILEEKLKKAEKDAHMRLRRGLLKHFYPVLPDTVKLDLLFRSAYPLPDNPYEIGTNAYVSILEDFHNERQRQLNLVPCITSNKLEPADRLYRKGFYATTVLVIGYAIFISVNRLVRDKKTVRYDPSDPVQDKNDRQQSRGTIGSIIVSCFFGTMNFLVDRYGAINPATSTALVGMCFGGTLGFLMDNTIGSDTGFAVFSERGKFQ